MCSNTNARVCNADAIKKYRESPKSPTVPGPVESAKIFIIENTPLMIPKPNPETTDRRDEDDIQGKRLNICIKLTI